MIFYFTLLGITVLLSFISTQEKKSARHKYGFFFFLTFILLVIAAGIRVGTGTDTTLYNSFFEYYPTLSLKEIWLNTSEPGLWSLSWFIGRFSENTYWTFIVVAAIIVGLIMMTIKKYSTNYVLSMFLYLAGMDYFSSYNGLRQWIVAAIVFFMMPLLADEKKPIKSKIVYCILLIPLFLIHNSAVLLFPIVFVVIQKPWSKRIWIVIIGAILAVIYFGQFLNILSGILGNSDYAQYTNISASDDGVNIFRVLVAFVPVILCAWKYKLINPDGNKMIDIYINFSLMNFLVLLIATRMTVLARLIYYLSIYNVLLFPLIPRAFNKSSRKIVLILMVLFFALYMYLLLPMDSNLIPYKDIFGHVFY